jgi:hypothetical protein
VTVMSQGFCPPITTPARENNVSTIFRGLDIWHLNFPVA